MRAQIEMVGDLAWDNYWVTDLDCPDGQPVEPRTETICARVCHLLDSPDEATSRSSDASGIPRILERERV